MKKTLALILALTLLLNGIILVSANQDYRLTDTSSVSWWQKFSTKLTQSIYIDGAMTDTYICQTGQTISVKFYMLTPFSEAGAIKSYKHTIFGNVSDRTDDMKNYYNAYGGGVLVQWAYNIQCPSHSGVYQVSEILETSNQLCPDCQRWDTQITVQGTSASTCSQKGGQICSPTAECYGYYISASDTDRCCSDSSGKFCIEACNENWQCSEWSSCSNNQQLRTCTDLSNCGDAYTQLTTCTTSGGVAEKVSDVTKEASKQVSDITENAKALGFKEWAIIGGVLLLLFLLLSGQGKK